MSKYLFGDADLLNSTLLPAHPYYWVSYSTSTTSGFLGRKVTTLTPSASFNAYATLGAAINWREETFEVGGRMKKWEDLTHKTGGMFSRQGPPGLHSVHSFYTDTLSIHSKREWTWSDRTYMVKFHDHDDHWTATLDAAENPPSAVFTVRKMAKSGKPPEPANIVFAPGVSPEDMAFLILVIIYSETKRVERDEEIADFVKEVVSGVVSG
ncbi:hypothetical protein Hypma_012149 [Hypsizygus marmoreus]|uniref:Uncharacterized protein n=1 Tax=Hypsizygus marmoreus TaxID=39966 RepID=A0A369JF61_HYPMA|nr:hypothetical protein Hypma_012149 [Hypsizygus marmoreus]